MTSSERVPVAAMIDDEDYPDTDGPEPTFGFRETPLSEGIWEAAGY